MSSRFNVPLLTALGFAAFVNYNSTQIISPKPSENFVEFLSIASFVVSFLYLLPAFVAFKQNAELKWLIFVLNLALGWSVIVWFLTLAMCNSKKEQTTTWHKI